MPKQALASREEITSVISITRARRSRLEMTKELTKALLETAEAGNTRAQAEKVASLLEIDDQLAAGRQELAQHDQRINDAQSEIDDIVVPAMNFLTANGKVAAANIRTLHRTQERLATELDDLYDQHKRVKKVAGELLNRHEGAINRLDDAASDMIRRMEEQEHRLSTLDHVVHDHEIFRHTANDTLGQYEARLAGYERRLASIEATNAVTTTKTAPATGDKPSIFSRSIFWSGVTATAVTVAYVLYPLFF